MASSLSSDDYLNIKLRPIFNALTESLIKEAPQDPVSFFIKSLRFSLWLDGLKFTLEFLHR